MTLLKVTFNELRDFRNGKNPQPGPSAPDRVAGGEGLGFGLFKPLRLKSGSARKFNQGNVEARRDGTVRRFFGLSRSSGCRGRGDARRPAVSRFYGDVRGLLLLFSLPRCFSAPGLIPHGVRALTHRISPGLLSLNNL